MITDLEIGAGKLPLTNAKQMDLILLVRRYSVYKQTPGKWPKFEDAILAVSGQTIPGVDDGTVPTTPENATMQQIKGMALDAVVTKLHALPKVVVETEGTDKQKSFFSAGVNWDELAQQVLDTLFQTTPLMFQLFLVVQRRTIQKECQQPFTNPWTGYRWWI